MTHTGHLRRLLSLTLALALVLAASLFTLAPPPALADSDPPPTFPFTKVYDFYDPDVEAGARLDDLISRMTLDEKMASGVGARLGVSGSRSGGGEGLHGVAWEGYATVFPSSLGLSQSWDKDLFDKIGDVIAKESLAANINATGRLSPVVDLLRDPRYGRAYETLGEDAYLTGSLATAMAGAMNGRTEDGYQQFIPILKHFMAYNVEINRLWVASSFSPRNTNEYYNKAFKYPVSAGASKSLMNSYPVVNGKPMSVNPLQHDLLYEWTPDYPGTGHYEYTTTNDYGSGSSILVHSQRYFDDTTNGRALGMAQGTKNGQQSWSFRNYGSADGLRYEALARGMATEQDFEENARRSLSMALRLGDLDQLRIANPYLQDPLTRYGPNRAYQIERNRGLALRAAQEQIVLLKNEDNTLPLKGDDVDKAVLLGPLADQVLKDFYSGSYTYRITIKDALVNKLGAANVSFNRAVDTVAIKAPNDKYLVNNNTAKTYVAPGSAGGEPPSSWPPRPETPELTPITATGDTAPTLTDNIASLFEIYDYGSTNKLLRTPVNGRYVQVTNNSAHLPYTMINNTSAPGEGNLDEAVSGQNLSYSNYQKFRITPVKDSAGMFGLYHVLSGDGINGGTGLAYDVDDEDTNRGSYLKLNAESNCIVADLDTNGPYKNENHVKGPDITDSPVDTDGGDDALDNLPATHQFAIENIQTAEQAAAAAVTAADDPDAPVILVLGYEPHLNAREGIDLYETGLSEQQTRLLGYVTDTLARDVILIVKTGNPMAIDETVANNPKVKAILEIGNTGQEEGSAIVSALFDDGYSVPATGFAPSGEYANEGLDYHHDFAAYPGYLPEGSRTIPAYAPAGRLSSTWYKSTEDMIGASEDHPPASYLYPDYDATGNDNLSNMNGTVNTGLLTYDIIKGERTYQYFRGTPLFAFGYGLTYTTFAYSDVTVSAVAADGTFTVSGTVTNVGGVTSDEVVQVYSSFAGPFSRIQQPIKRLIAYDRLPAIEPDETRDFSFEVDLRDKLGVWDVESGRFIVEIGRYTIVAGGSSAVHAAARNSVVLDVTATNGGTAAPARNLAKLTLAENFDDYLIYNPGSGALGVVDTVEFISSSVDYDSNTAVQFRRNGTWLAFKNVTFASAPAMLTVRAGAEKPGALTVYAVFAGVALNTATPVANFALTDTRPTGSTYGEAGIGPAGVYPGTPAGQETQNRYLRPELRTTAVSAANLNANTAYDIYVVAEKRGTVLEWLKFGAATDNVAAGVAISQVYSQDSIREQGGALALRADLTPVTSTQPVTWTVASTDGTPTALATIDPAAGVLTAAGIDNGTVRVTAAAGTRTATKDILITNQLDADKTTFDTTVPDPANPQGPPRSVSLTRTVDYMLIRSLSVTSFVWDGDVISRSTYWDASDSISRHQGALQQTAVFKALFSESDGNYVATDSYLALPGDAVTWSVANRAGTGPALATIDAAGLLTATGEDDGDVVVRAVLKSNTDIVSERVIRLQNQTPKDAFKIIEAENWDAASAGTDTTGSAYVADGNEIGVYQDAAATRLAHPSLSETDPTPPAVLTYKNVDFGGGASIFQLRLAADAAATVELWIDAADTVDGGTRIGTLAVTPTGGDNYAKYETLTACITETAGVKDLYLKVFPTTPTGMATLRLSRFQFADIYTVTFDSADGSAVPSQEILHGASASDPGAPTRQDYFFDGWYTAAAAGSIWTFDNPVTSDLTLYAHWTKIHIVSFVVTNSNDRFPSQQVLHGAPAADPGTPARVGYEFGGWYTAEAGGSKWNFDDLVTADLTLYARWLEIIDSGGRGGPPASTPATYQVTFDSQGGSDVATQSVARGGAAKKPSDPTRSGSVFAGWYTDAAGTAAYSFATPVTASIALYAKWTVEGAPAPDTPDVPSGPLDGFSDAGQVSSWAAEFVERLVAAEIISGRPNGTIDPKGNVTRAEFTKMIVLGLRLEAGEAPKSFADVAAGDWFKSVVDAASSRGIVLGVSETAFAPNRTISRQDLCTIVYRGLVAQEMTLPALEDDGAFPDEAQIASYALDAVKTLKQLNIVTGRSSGAFDPRAYATREETAKIICGVIDTIASASAPASTEPDSTEPASTEPDSTTEPAT